MVDDSVNGGIPVQGEDQTVVGAAADDRRDSNGVDVTEDTPGAGGADVTEGTPGADSSVEDDANTRGSAMATDVVNALELYDKTSQVSATVTTFPATIGNADHCDLALKGPGPEGVYARVRNERNVFIAQLADADVSFSVNERSLQSVILMDGDVLALGDHEVRVRFTHVEPSEQADVVRRGRRRWRLMAGLGGVTLVLLFLWIFSAMGGTDRPSSPSGHRMQSESASRPDRDRSDTVVQSQQEPTSRAGQDAAAKVNTPASPQPLTAAETKQSQPKPIKTQQVVASILGHGQALQADPSPEMPSNNESSTTEVSSATGDIAKPESPAPAAPKDTGQPAHDTSHRSKSHIAQAQRREITSTVLQHVRESYAKNGAVAAEKILRSAPSDVDTSQLAKASAVLDRARRAFRRAQQAAADGDLDELVDSRRVLAHAEHTLELDTASRWLRKISDRAVVLYQRAAQRTLDRGAQAQAYTWYQRVLAIRPDGTAAQAAVEQIVASARRWYLQGYKLEYRTLKSALECWRRVVNILPPGTHWHQLAQAKLYEYRDFEAS